MILREVTEPEFKDFINHYPRPLETDIIRFGEPNRLNYHDWTIGKNWESIVASVSIDNGVFGDWRIL